MKVTAEQVKAAIKAGNVTRIDHHDCGFCGYMTAYLIGDAGMFFDPGCYCGRLAPYERRSFEEIAERVNMQTNEEHAQRIWQKIEGHQ